MNNGIFTDKKIKFCKIVFLNITKSNMEIEHTFVGNGKIIHGGNQSKYGVINDIFTDILLLFIFFLL